MKTQTFTASILQEDDWFIAQCLEVDVSSQGKSEDEAVDNLREALELYFEPPRPTTTVMPKLRKFEVNINSEFGTTVLRTANMTNKPNIVYLLAI